MASRVGLEGLTIGVLADELELSKSGLFAHFKSKEALQLQVLEFGIARFVETVVKPALAAPRGEKRVRALFEHWLEWPKSSGLAGCLFVAFWPPSWTTSRGRCASGSCNRRRTGWT